MEGVSRSKVLFISLPGIGTKLYDPKAMKGVREVVEKENVEYIALTGALPEIPLRWGKRLMEKFRKLDSLEDVQRKYGGEVYQELTERYAPGEAGIKTPEDAAVIAKHELSWLREKAKQGKVRVVYVWSIYDWENVKWTVEMRLRELTRPRDIEARLEEYRNLLMELRGERRRILEDMNMAGERGDYELLSYYTSQLEQVDSGIMRIQNTIEYLERMLEEAERGPFTTTPADTEMLKKVIDVVVEREYMRLLREILGEGVEIYPFNRVELGDIVISYNSNMIFSNIPLKSILKRLSDIVTRDPDPASLYVELGAHTGGFRAVEHEIRGKEVILMNVPKLTIPVDELVKNFAIKKVYKLHDVKAHLKAPSASGVVVIDLEEKEISFYPVEYLRTLADDGEPEKRYSIIAFGDVHAGAENPEPKEPTNIEYLEITSLYIEKKNPDLVVNVGDNLHGAHRFETTNPFFAPSPDEQLRLYREVGNRVFFLSPVINLDKQLELFLKHSKDLKNYLEKGGRLLIVSGNHFNKTTFAHIDEANLIAVALGDGEGNRIYKAPGASEGVGYHEILGFKVYAIHSARLRYDVVFGLMEHVLGKGLDVDLAFSGHYHTPGIGYANGIAFTVSPALKQPSNYEMQIKAPLAPRGFIEIEVFELKKTKAYRWKLLTGRKMRELFEELKDELSIYQ